MKSVEIIRVTIDRILELQEVSRTSFFETYASFNTEADMQHYLQVNFSLETLQKELENPATLFFFANWENEIIGYLKLNFAAAQTCVYDPASLEVERIYVLKKYQGLKIGQQLFTKSVAVAREHKCAYLWLGVWEKNTNALAFYRKNGLEEFDRHEFILGEDVQLDYLMKLRL